MKKPDNSMPVSDDTLMRRAQREWDDRIQEAAVSKRRMFALAGGGLLFGFGGFAFGVNERSKAADPIVHYAEKCRDQLLAVVSADTPGELAAQDIADKLKAWVRGAREVSLDASHMRRAVWDTYRMTEASSQAEEKLKAFHAANSPADRSARETVILERQTAMPDGPASSRTWRMEWREVATARDGRLISAEDWRMGLTFTVRRPTTVAEIERNWSGIFVQTFHWERVRPADGLLSSAGGAGR